MNPVAEVKTDPSPVQDGNFTKTAFGVFRRLFESGKNNVSKPWPPVPARLGPKPKACPKAIQLMRGGAAHLRCAA